MGKVLERNSIPLVQDSEGIKSRQYNRDIDVLVKAINLMGGILLSEILGTVPDFNQLPDITTQNFGSKYVVIDDTIPHKDGSVMTGNNLVTYMVGKNTSNQKVWTVFQQGLDQLALVAGLINNKGFVKEVSDLLNANGIDTRNWVGDGNINPDSGLFNGIPKGTLLQKGDIYGTTDAVTKLFIYDGVKWMEVYRTDSNMGDLSDTQNVINQMSSYEEEVEYHGTYKGHDDVKNLISKIRLLEHFDKTGIYHFIADVTAVNSKVSFKERVTVFMGAGSVNNTTGQWDGISLGVTPQNGDIYAKFVSTSSEDSFVYYRYVGNKWILDGELKSSKVTKLFTGDFSDNALTGWKQGVDVQPVEGNIYIKKLGNDLPDEHFKYVSGAWAYLKPQDPYFTNKLYTDKTHLNPTDTGSAVDGKTVEQGDYFVGYDKTTHLYAYFVFLGTQWFSVHPSTNSFRKVSVYTGDKVINKDTGFWNGIPDGTILHVGDIYVNEAKANLHYVYIGKNKWAVIRGNSTLVNLVREYESYKAEFYVNKQTGEVYHLAENGVHKDGPGQTLLTMVVNKLESTSTSAWSQLKADEVPNKKQIEDKYGDLSGKPVRTVDFYSEVDKDEHNTLYIVGSMTGITSDNGYDFKPGEGGIVLVDKNGNIYIQQLPDDLWGNFKDIVDALDKGVKNNTESIEGVEQLVSANSDDILKRTIEYDYTKLTTQKELYDKVLADKLIPGTTIKLTVGGVTFYARAVGLDEIKKEFVYEIEGDWYTADGDHVTSFRKATAVGTSTDLLAEPKAGLIQAIQFKATQAATEDKQLIRFKEFKKTKDMAIINKVAISVMQGRTFTITGSSFIKALARLADFLNTPIPTHYTDWVTAIATEVGFDALFDATGQWLTTPQAQWAKTHLFEATPSELTDQPIRFNLSFRGYKADGTLSDVHDQLSASAVAQVNKQSLMKEFLALTLYKESDTMKTLQTILDNIAGIATDAGFQIDNIIKSAGVPALVKFADGSAVNQQAAPAWSKTESDDLYADIKLSNIKDILNKGMVLSLDPVTGKIKWIDPKTFKQDNAVVEKMVDGTGKTSKQVLAENLTVTNQKTILIVKGVSDIKDLTFDDSLIYINDGVNWVLTNPKDTSQGIQAFTPLMDLDDHDGEQNWTENGIEGFREFVYANDSIYGSNPDRKDVILNFYGMDWLGWIGYIKRMSSSPTPVHMRIFKANSLVIKNPLLRFSLDLGAATRNQAGLRDDAKRAQDMEKIYDYMLTGDTAKEAYLNSNGYPTTGFKNIVWKDVIVDTTVLSPNPTMIPYTSNSGSGSSQYTGVRLYATKVFNEITFFVKPNDMDDWGGFQGLILAVIGLRVDDAVESHQATSGADLTALKLQVTHNHDALGKKLGLDIFEKEKGIFTSADTSVGISESVNADGKKVFDFSVKDPRVVNAENATGAEVEVSVDDSDPLQYKLSAKLSKIFSDKFIKALADIVVNATNLTTTNTSVSNNTTAIAGQAAAIAAGLSWKGTKPATPSAGDVYITPETVGGATLNALIIYDGTKEVKLIDPSLILNIVRASDEFVQKSVYDAKILELTTSIGEKVKTIDFDGLKIRLENNETAIKNLQDTKIDKTKYNADQKVQDDKAKATDLEVAKKQVKPTNDTTATAGMVQTFTSTGVSEWKETAIIGMSVPAGNVGKLLRVKADNTLELYTPQQAMPYFGEFDTKVLLDAATGMKDKDLAFVVDGDQWYEYDGTSWNTHSSAGFNPDHLFTLNSNLLLKNDKVSTKSAAIGDGYKGSIDLFSGTAKKISIAEGNQDDVSIAFNSKTINIGAFIKEQLNIGAYGQPASLIAIGEDSQGSIKIGSNLSPSAKQTLIDNNKSATFEDVIKVANGELTMKGNTPQQTIVIKTNPVDGEPTIYINGNPGTKIKDL